MRAFLNKNFKLLKILPDILFPKQCILCQMDKVLLCGDCENQLDLNKKTLPAWIHAKYSYGDENMRKIIFKIKYNHTPELATEMGEYSKQFLENKIENFDQYILIPVPISKKRMQERGYNQALYISNGIDKNKTVDILERVKHTNKLFKTKHRDDRINEIQNSFKIKDEYLELVMGKNILLIDDVTTTGATLYEIKKILELADAKKVRAFTLAH